MDCRLVEPDGVVGVRAQHSGCLVRGKRDQDTVAVAVRTALTSSTWAHFVCHAGADPVSPAEGGLLLHDRTLRLFEIGGLRIAEACPQWAMRHPGAWAT